MEAKKLLLFSVLALLPLSVAPIRADEPNKESIEGIWYAFDRQDKIVLKDGICTLFNPLNVEQAKFDWVDNAVVLGNNLFKFEFDFVNPDLAITLVSRPIPLEVFEEQEREQERERREATIRESFKNAPEARRLLLEKIREADAAGPSQRPPRQNLPNDGQPSPIDLAKTETGEPIIVTTAGLWSRVDIAIDNPPTNLSNAAHEPSITGLWKRDDKKLVAISPTRYCVIDLDKGPRSEKFGKLRLVAGNRFSLLDKYDEPKDHFWEFQVINREIAILSEVEGSAETATELQRPRKTVLLSRVW